MRRFWDDLPVAREGVENGEIDSSRIVSHEPVPLPDGFHWSVCTLDESHEFLREQYIHEGENFHFRYTRDVLKWSTQLPGYETLVIRRSDRTIVGHISGVPMRVRFESEVVDAIQMNYLCIHSDFREAKLVPLLILESRRRANLKNMWHGVGTAVRSMFNPVIKSKYWHRLLNVEHLHMSGFHKTNRLNEKFHRVRGPSKFTWRRMTIKDVRRVTEILKKYNSQFKLAAAIDDEYVEKWLLPINTYINEENDKIISFYEIPYHKSNGSHIVNQAYRFCITEDVYNDAFIIAKNLDYDVFNTLDVGIEPEILKTNKFLEGSGHVYYYLFNWHLSQDVRNEDVHMILP